MGDADWGPLDVALDNLECQGGQARFWWRDDDAIEDTAALRRLVDLARRFRVPILLAVVPARARPNLAALLDSTDTLVLAVHGFAHVNHAGPGEKKQELCGHRDTAVVLNELSLGRDRLADMFGDRLAPVLVPPWNRIAPEIAARLPDIGFEGLSAFGPEEATGPVAGLKVVNTHLDPIDWHGSRSLGDLGAMIGLAAAHIRRCAQDESRGAFGILTHHLVHDDAIWTFVEALLTRTADHPGVRWSRPRGLFCR
jgi:hypothetical protein